MQAYLWLSLAATHLPSGPLRAQATRTIGGIARPDDVFVSTDLPKTRSGKIRRRLLKDIAEGRAMGDTPTLADPTVVSRLREMYEEKER